MPIVDIFGNASWLPDETQVREAKIRAERIGSASSGFPYRFDLTRRLILVLPKMVARAMSDIDKQKYMPGEIKIRVHRQHPWDFNHDDWAIDIQPGDREAAELVKFDDELGKGRELRRKAIADDVSSRINRWLTQPDVKVDIRPTFEVECRPLDGSGIVSGPDGDAVLAW